MGLFAKLLKSSNDTKQTDTQSTCCAPLTFEEDAPAAQAPKPASSTCCAPLTFEEDEAPASCCS